MPADFSAEPPAAVAAGRTCPSILGSLPPLLADAAQAAQTTWKKTIEHNIQ